MLRSTLLTIILIIISEGLYAQVFEKNQGNPPNHLGLSPDKQISQYLFDSWQRKDGLPQNTVSAIIQNREGYLWLATPEGVVRFDGLDFVVFTRSMSHAIESNEVISVYEDRESRLWFGTSAKGLFYYQNGHFRQDRHLRELASLSVRAFTEDEQGRLWIGTNQGLYCYYQQQLKSFGTHDGLSSRNITALYKGQDGNLWIGTSRGLSRYHEGQFEDYARSKIVFISKVVTDIREDTQGNLWIATHTGLIRWRPQTEEYSIFRLEEGLQDDYVTRLWVDNYNSLWIGTQSGGLHRIKAPHVSLEEPPLENLGVQEGLSANSITSIYQDREGSLWLGLNRGGLNRLWEGKFTNYTRMEGLSDDVTNCIYETREGGLWIGTVSGGLTYLKDSTFRHYTQAQGLANNSVRSVVEDYEGNLWVGTYGSGVDKIRFAPDGSIRSLENYRLSKGLAGNLVRALYVSRDSSVLIGTNTGLSRYRQGTFENYTRKLGLSDDAIVGVLEDDKGNIWLGTEEGGVNCIRKDQSILIYNQRSGLADDQIFALYQDRSGVIWVGTKGGLSRIKHGEVTNLYVQDGLPSDAIHGILEDDYGLIWLSSSHGVCWIEKATLDAYLDQKKPRAQPYTPLNFVLYEEEDGMKSADCAAATQPSTQKDQYGNLWFPTTRGISKINPRDIRENTIVPPVTIKQLVAGNQTYTLFDKIRLEAGTNKIEIDFAALSFLAPSKIRYRYKLRGSRYKEDWVEAGNKRDAYYTNLPPGQYTFRVQASNSDGVWNEEGASIRFYLAPFFYQTKWFYLLCILLIISLGFGVYHWRLRSLEKSKRNLERGIAENTRKIRQQYQEITQQAEELETVNNIVRTINQELKFEKVLKALLEQGLLLFSESHQGVFLLYDYKEDVYQVAASSGYEEGLFENMKFSLSEIEAYCRAGVAIETDIYRLQPRVNLQKLAPGYHPKASLALPIHSDERLEGILFFDNAEGFSTMQPSDIQKLSRFREHAVSAFVKARMLQELEEKNHQVETSFRKISDSIRYARRIQKAILPSEEEFSHIFSDYFILYRPRDIVSGDFYWFTETMPEPIFALEQAGGDHTSVFKGFNEVKSVFAAIDCTGHGVPGAFMTVIANDLLNAIVIEDKISRAHSILDQLDRNVRVYLKQEDSTPNTRDGMDMGLLVLDEQEESIEFAGAKNTLYQIRDGELRQIKGSKFPIGGGRIKNKTFNSQKIHYQKGDRFYLFSDGFVDQFGGADDRKFGSRRFRELLLNTQTLSLADQKKALEDTLNKWQGSNRQTDDILVIGFTL